MINDRAMVAANTVLQIITDAELESELVPDELRFRLWRYLRDEFDDIARQIASEQQEESEMEEYEMGPTTKVPDIRGMTTDDTVDAIVAWFFANFEDPAESTSYCSAEGGYLYCCGGPYLAAEEIAHAFGSAITDEILDVAVELIEADGIEEWAANQGRMQAVVED